MHLALCSARDAHVGEWSGAELIGCDADLARQRSIRPTRDLSGLFLALAQTEFATSPDTETDPLLHASYLVTTDVVNRHIDSLLRTDTWVSAKVCSKLSNWDRPQR